MGTILTISGDVYYGFSIKNDATSPSVTRIGNMGMHRNLPIQSRMKSCLLAADGTVNYYLKADDHTKKADGSPSLLDGTDGDVMVEVPNFFYKSERLGVYDYNYFSLYPLPGYSRIIGLNIDKFYVSAYEAGIDRSTNKLMSFINSSTQYRGGNNNSAWDAGENSLLGKPATSISRTNFRTYARNKGSNWEMYTYGVHRAITLLFILEYGTRYNQMAINTALDSNGFKQGGLGAGVTNINSGLWNTFNAYNPFISMGYSNSLGNGSGEVDYVMPASYGTLTTKVNRYRGIELPFGHIWKNTDGLNWKASASEGNVSYYTDNPSLFNDANYTGYDLIGTSPSSNNWISKMFPGHIIPEGNAGDLTTYWTDYIYQSLPGSGESLRTVLFGGGAAFEGSRAGFGCSSSDFSPAITDAYIGSRLCYFPIV